MPRQNACNAWRRPPRHKAPVHYHAINPADLVVEERLPLAGANGMVHRVAPQCREGSAAVSSRDRDFRPSRRRDFDDDNYQPPTRNFGYAPPRGPESSRGWGQTRTRPPSQRLPG